MRYICLLFLLLSLPLCHSIEVSLNDAKYLDGTVSTDMGGIIITPEMRIQAKHIRYREHANERNIEAWGDILVIWRDKTCIGERIFYDCIARKGVICSGRMSIDVWHISGNRIELYPDDTYCLFDATITTSNAQNPLFTMCAQRLDIEKNILTAKSVHMQYAGYPYLLLPKYSMNLQRLWKAPDLQYKVFWDKGVGPCGMIRYRVYTNKNCNSHLRFDVRLHKGEKPILRLGSALETEYLFPKERGKICIKNYLGYDTPFNDPNNFSRMRYRLQGIASYKFPNGRQTFFSQWDKISDRNMPNDFHMDSFELSTEKKTEAHFRTIHKRIITNISCVPRFNTFDTMKQELPEIKFSPYPLILKSSGIVFENSLQAGYYRYSFADDSHSYLTDFSSSKLKYSQTLYRAISSPYLTILPKIGCHYLLYGNSPTHRPLQFCLPFYDISVHTRLLSSKEKILHICEPYAKIYSLSSPPKESSPFIFDLSDGWGKINQMRFGIRNMLYLRDQTTLPFVSIDIYTLGFFQPTDFTKTFPKFFTNMECNLPRLSIKTLLGWNIQYATLDIGNIRAALTCSEDFALSVEFRFRDKMSWRKNNPDNYLLDVTRSHLALLHSLLSDERKVAIMRMQLKIHPQWIVRIEGNYGWGRKLEKSHFVGKIDLLGIISSNWRITLSYVQAASRRHFECGLSLVRF